VNLTFIHFPAPSDNARPPSWLKRQPPWATACRWMWAQFTDAITLVKADNYW